MVLGVRGGRCCRVYIFYNGVCAKICFKSHTEELREHGFTISMPCTIPVANKMETRVHILTPV